MGWLESLGFTLGAGFASGLNVYATVAALGLMHRFEIAQLPRGLEALAHPLVLGLALLLYLVEFAADKIPYVDTLWDFIHTFIRPPAAALVAYSALGDVPEVWQLGAGLLAGGVALTSHGAKASTRAAVNASPEPFSNSVLSVAEDGLAIFLAWMALTHPVVTAAIIAALLALATYLVVTLFGFARRRLAAYRAQRAAGRDTGATTRVAPTGTRPTA